MPRDRDPDVARARPNLPDPESDPELGPDPTGVAAVARLEIRGL